MKTTINSSYVYISDCNIADIKQSIKGLQLLQKKVTKIEVFAHFDFDTKYYHRFPDEKINALWKRCYRNNVEVTLKNDRLYYHNFVLPVLKVIDTVTIYFE